MIKNCELSKLRARLLILHTKIDQERCLTASGRVCPRNARIRSARFKARFRSISTILALSSESFRNASTQAALVTSLWLTRHRSTLMGNSVSLVKFLVFPAQGQPL